MKCAECQCTPLDCKFECATCTKEVCCCIGVSVKKKQVFNFFKNISSLYATALAIEILCISAAEIGQNSSFILFGYRTSVEVALGYLLGYSLAAFTTFATILGHSTYSDQMCSCCSVLEQGPNGFTATLLTTFKNCGS